MTAAVRRDRAYRLRVYRRFAAIGAQQALAYRANYLMNIVRLVIQVFLLTLVWTAVYDGRDSVDGVTLSTMVSYVTLATVQMWLVMTSSFSLIPQRVRTGKIAADLCRPVGPLQQSLADQIGRAGVILPVALLALPITSLVGGMQPPASALAGIAYAVSLLLAFTVAMLMATVVSMVAFWTLEVGGILSIYRSVSEFFAGALVPLWLMPDWLRVVAEVLPFQAMAYTPVAIYLGRLSGADMTRALAVQLAWVVAGYLLGRLVWSRALHRVVIQGG